MQLRGRVDRGEAAADDDGRQLHLQVRQRVPLKAPVSCSAIRKSLALRMPRMRLFFMPMIVGLPAPAAMAMWSKPSSHASSIVSVPPKRTPP